MSGGEYNSLSYTRRASEWREAQEDQGQTVDEAASEVISARRQPSNGGEASGKSDWEQRAASDSDDSYLLPAQANRGSDKKIAADYEASDANGFSAWPIDTTQINDLTPETQYSDTQYNDQAGLDAVASNGWAEPTDNEQAQIISPTLAADGGDMVGDNPDQIDTQTVFSTSSTPYLGEPGDRQVAATEANSANLAWQTFDAGTLDNTVSGDPTSADGNGTIVTMAGGPEEGDIYVPSDDGAPLIVSDSEAGGGIGPIASDGSTLVAYNRPAVRGDALAGSADDTSAQQGRTNNLPETTPTPLFGEPPSDAPVPSDPNMPEQVDFSPVRVQPFGFTSSPANGSPVQTSSDVTAARREALADSIITGLDDVVAKRDPKLATDVRQVGDLVQVGRGVAGLLNGTPGSDKRLVDGAVDAVAAGFLGQDAAEIASAALATRATIDSAGRVDNKNTAGDIGNMVAAAAGIGKSGILGADTAKTATTVETYAKGATAVANVLDTANLANVANLASFGIGQLFGNSPTGQIASNTAGLVGAAAAGGPLSIMAAGVGLMGSVVDAFSEKWGNFSDQLDINGDGKADKIQWEAKSHDYLVSLKDVDVLGDANTKSANFKLSNPTLAWDGENPLPGVRPYERVTRSGVTNTGQVMVSLDAQGKIRDTGYGGRGLNNGIVINSAEIPKYAPDAWQDQYGKPINSTYQGKYLEIEAEVKSDGFVAQNSLDRSGTRSVRNDYSGGVYLNPDQAKAFEARFGASGAVADRNAMREFLRQQGINAPTVDMAYRQSFEDQGLTYFKDVNGDGTRDQITTYFGQQEQSAADRGGLDLSSESGRGAYRDDSTFIQFTNPDGSTGFGYAVNAKGVLDKDSLAGRVATAKGGLQNSFTLQRDVNGDGNLDRLTVYSNTGGLTNGDDSVLVDLRDKSGAVLGSYAFDKQGKMANAGVAYNVLQSRKVPVR